MRIGDSTTEGSRAAGTPFLRIAMTVVVLVGSVLMVGAMTFGAMFACYKQPPHECAAAQTAWTLAAVTSAVAGVILLIVVWTTAPRRRWLLRGAAILALPLLVTGYAWWQAEGVRQEALRVTVTRVEPAGDRQLVCWEASPGPPPLEPGCHDAFDGFDIEPGSQVRVIVRRNSRTGPWEIDSVWPDD